MSGAKPLLLNGGEVAVHTALEDALRTHGLHLDTKVRVGSMLPIDGSGIDKEDFSYALRAEFDFVVSKGSTRKPEFVVEFDGERHLHDPATIARDRRKERLCTRFEVPLLRIGSEALNKARKETILAWLIDVYYVHEAFERQQAAGYIPADEPFLHFTVFDLSPDGGFGQSVALDHEARIQMHAAYDDGVCARDVPDELTVDIWDPDTRPELVESFALLEVDADNFIVGHSTVRNFQRFGGISASQLATDLAVAIAGRRLALYRKGRFQPMSREGVARIRSKTESWCLNGFPPKFRTKGVRGPSL
jgi:hypothetical protein